MSSPMISRKYSAWLQRKRQHRRSRWRPLLSSTSCPVSSHRPSPNCSAARFRYSSSPPRSPQVDCIGHRIEEERKWDCGETMPPRAAAPGPGRPAARKRPPARRWQSRRPLAGPVATCLRVVSVAREATPCAIWVQSPTINPGSSHTWPRAASRAKWRGLWASHRLQSDPRAGRDRFAADTKAVACTDPDGYGCAFRTSP